MYLFGMDPPGFPLNEFLNWHGSCRLSLGERWTLKGRDAITGPWQVEFMHSMKILSLFPSLCSSYCPCGL